ncbi:hypoxanthine-guanine phosphoribosyltransferase [Bacillus pakistanensis]|uniref:Hypoxanthine-guanine phosphoribosyltransferase n=1 Tax=Rossellomorea pakistanensis TaxID=992288 RepID=A0ABS2NHY5_9BACI|nr:hypothetical protein [Bacillus pakistanensis]MBM7587435.1 hypoxanthine-guanine phosphoribosyltransferase [Bacillus pakistanensis]
MGAAAVAVVEDVAAVNNTLSNVYRDCLIRRAPAEVVAGALLYKVRHNRQITLHRIIEGNNAEYD